jgi:hypothetical protein
MDNEELKKVCKFWYKRQDVQWELLKAIRSHSSDFKGEQNASRFWRIGDFKFLIGRLQEMFIESENPYWAFFHSVANLRMVTSKGTPADWQQDWDFNDCVYGYDLPIDFEDPELHKKIKDNKFVTKEEVTELIKMVRFDVLKLCLFLTKEKCPFRVSFTGCSGFHVTIDWADVATKFDAQTYGNIKKDLGMFICEQAELAKDKDGNFKYVDVNILGATGRALIRTDCSLHQKTGLVVLPLNVSDLSSFSVEMADPYKLPTVRDRIIQKKSKGDASPIIERFLKLQGKEVKQEKKKLDTQQKTIESIKEQIGKLDNETRKRLMSELNKEFT